MDMQDASCSGKLPTNGWGRRQVVSGSCRSPSSVCGSPGSNVQQSHTFSFPMHVLSHPQQTRPKHVQWVVVRSSVQTTKQLQHSFHSMLYGMYVGYHMHVYKEATPAPALLGCRSGQVPETFSTCPMPFQ